MPIADMEQLVGQVIAIRAERVAPHFKSALLARINKGLSARRVYGWSNWRS
ncbi:MAG: hypothetical protein J2P21_27850 [Chloracidobacterium sp.]|nr:hypothetical protein [Chloracidobacterium sp.]